MLNNVNIDTSLFKKKNLNKLALVLYGLINFNSSKSKHTFINYHYIKKNIYPCSRRTYERAIKSLKDNKLIIVKRLFNGLECDRYIDNSFVLDEEKSYILNDFLNHIN